MMANKDRIRALEDRVGEIEDVIGRIQESVHAAIEIAATKEPTAGPSPKGLENTPLPGDSKAELIVKAMSRVAAAQKMIDDNPGIDDLGHGSLKGNLFIQEELLRELVNPEDAALHRHLRDYYRVHGKF
jgi:hypothetical protein